MLTAIVLSHNSSATLARILESVTFCDQLIVVDDYSTDNSVEIAERHGAKVVSHALAGDYAAHHNWAVSQASTSDWILLLHHDEIITPDLQVQIHSAITNPSPGVNGYYIPRQDIIWGHTLKYGDVFGAKFLRLAKPGSGKWVGRIHEVWHVSGTPGYFSAPMLHYPHTSVSDFLSAINAYSTIRAHELYSMKKKANIVEIIILPQLKFFLNYCLKFGFLDGIPGFIHAMIMSFYTFLVRGKLFLLHKGIQSS